MTTSGLYCTKESFSKELPEGFDRLLRLSTSSALPQLRTHIRHVSPHRMSLFPSDSFPRFHKLSLEILGLASGGDPSGSGLPNILAVAYLDKFNGDLEVLRHWIP